MYANCLTLRPKLSHQRRKSDEMGTSCEGVTTVAILGRGRASFSGIASGSVQRAPRSQVVMPGGRGPGPPGAVGYEPRPQDATPRSAFRIVSRRRPSMSEDANLRSGILRRLLFEALIVVHVASIAMSTLGIVANRKR